MMPYLKCEKISKQLLRHLQSKQDSAGTRVSGERERQGWHKWQRCHLWGRLVALARGTAAPESPFPAWSKSHLLKPVSLKISGWLTKLLASREVWCHTGDRSPGARETQMESWHGHLLCDLRKVTWPLWASVSWFIYLLVHKVFIDCLLYTRKCSSCWRQRDMAPALMEFTVWTLNKWYNWLISYGK